MLKKVLIIIGFACAVWAFCGALIGVGRQLLSMDATLIVHAIGVPIGAALTLDVLVVAMLIEKGVDMFRSPLGVWIPQALIFMATWMTGSAVMRISVQAPR